MNKFCSNCGEELKGNQFVCLNCGVKVNNEIKQDDKFANTGFILGLVSIIAWIIPLFGYPVSICGIIFSSKGLNSLSKNKAICGIIFSIIFLVLTLINSIIGVLLNVILY